MAYNVLKGMVEGSVDQHANQEIDGIKIFKNTISASVFYDTDAQSPCATLKDVAINEIEGGMRHSVLTYQADGKARCEYNLTFKDGLLTTKAVHADKFVGSGEELTHLPVNKFEGKIGAQHLNTGLGLHSVRERLQVKARNGLETDEDGLHVALSRKSGLSFLNKELAVDPHNTANITDGAQNLSDNDLLIVYDVSRHDVRHTSLTNMVSSYLQEKMPHAEGARGCVQFKGKHEFESSPALTYEASNQTLTVNGSTHTETLKVLGKSIAKGAVYKNIITVDNKEYKIQDSDYTILFDTSQHKIRTVLPPACNHKGRVILIKKINALKYKLNSNVLIVEVEEGEIDFRKSIELKFTYSTLTLQSDGEKWWIVSRTGS